jgi:hypothetical protein
MPPGAAQAAQVASARWWLRAADPEQLRVLWARRTGGKVRDFTDGTVEVLTPAGERIVRGTPDVITDWLRARLVRLEAA